MFEVFVGIVIWEILRIIISVALWVSILEPYFKNKDEIIRHKIACVTFLSIEVGFLFWVVVILTKKRSKNNARKK